MDKLKLTNVDAPFLDRLHRFPSQRFTSMAEAPRILILSASVGAGHLRAAQAVELAAKRLSAAGRGREEGVAG